MWTFLMHCLAFYAVYKAVRIGTRFLTAGLDRFTEDTEHRIRYGRRQRRFEEPSRTRRYRKVDDYDPRIQGYIDIEEYDVD